MSRACRRSLPLAFAAALILASAAPAQAAAGDLDPTFAGGMVFTDFMGRDESAHGVAVAAGGKVVVAGTSETGTFDVEVMRYTTGGILDATFSGDGVKTTNFGGDDHGQAVAIAPDGKIVVAGYQLNPAPNSSAIVARYTTTGALDTTFSGDGKKVVDWPGVNQSGAYGVAVQPDGKIVIGGFAFGDFAAARLNVNGSYDATFDGDGRQIVDIGPNDAAFAVDVTPDGKTVLAGNAIADNASFARFGVARLKADGSLDGSFSGDGVLRTAFTGEDAFAKSVAVHPDGKIVAAGQVSAGPGSNFALVQYKTTGALDTSFGVGGRKTTDFAVADAANGVAVQTDGKVVAGGTAVDGVGDSDFALARYTTTGHLDGGFGAGGKVTTGFGAPDQADAVAISPLDGKIVLAGGTLAGPDPSNFAVCRYLAA